MKHLGYKFCCFKESHFWASLLRFSSTSGGIRTNRPFHPNFDFKNQGFGHQFPNLLGFADLLLHVEPPVVLSCCLVLFILELPDNL